MWKKFADERPIPARFLAIIHGCSRIVIVERCSMWGTLGVFLDEFGHRLCGTDIDLWHPLPEAPEEPKPKQ